MDKGNNTERFRTEIPTQDKRLSWDTAQKLLYNRMQLQICHLFLTLYLDITFQR